MHAGYGVWISQDEYRKTKFKAKLFPKKFIKGMSRFIFMVEVLKNSSVTGQLSNKEKKNSDATPRPALENRKMRALKGTSPNIHVNDYFQIVNIKFIHFFMNVRFFLHKIFFPFKI